MRGLLCFGSIISHDALGVALVWGLLSRLSMCECTSRSRHAVLFAPDHAVVGSLYEPVGVRLVMASPSVPPTRSRRQRRFAPGSDDEAASFTIFVCILLGWRSYAPCCFLSPGNAGR